MGHTHDVSIIWDVWPFRILVWWPLRFALDIVFLPIFLLTLIPVTFWNFIPTTIETVAYSITLIPLIWGLI